MRKEDSKILSVHEPVKEHVTYCTEPRIRKEMPRLIQEHYGLADSVDYDLCVLSGGGGNLAGLDVKGRGLAIIDEIKDVAFGAHHGRGIIILNHRDCGAYKIWARKAFSSDQEEEERQFHHGELRKSGQRLRQEFPDAPIRLGYVYVTDKDTWAIEDVSLE